MKKVILTKKGIDTWNSVNHVRVNQNTEFEVISQDYKTDRTTIRSSWGETLTISLSDFIISNLEVL